MDIRTGRTYETYDEAVRDGVPESDIARVTTRDGAYWPRFNRSKHQPHQSTREIERRKRQAAKAE